CANRASGRARSADQCLVQLDVAVGDGAERKGIVDERTLPLGDTARDIAVFEQTNDGLGECSCGVGGHGDDVVPRAEAGPREVVVAHYRNDGDFRRHYLEARRSESVALKIVALDIGSSDE